MWIIKPASLGLSTRSIEYRRKFGLSISVMLHVPFHQGEQGQLWGEQSLWKFLAQEMATPLVDEGVGKLHSEFLVHGYAYTSGDRQNACAVKVQLGDRAKTFLVMGDRYWDGNQASEPLPFDKMPLTWQRAYGGADFKANVQGIGRTAEQGVQRLPNIELPDQRILRKDQVVMPAGFGALDVMAEQRFQYRGTYDANYLKEHSPGYPPDLDWRYFNMSMPDQWFDKPLVGNERFALHNLHPSKPLIEGQLPSLKARVFADYAVASGSTKLKEVPMRLGTVWFFPHAERCVLVFHGLAEVGTDDGSDVVGLMGAVERLGEPKPHEHYLKVIEMRADPKLGGVHSLRDSDLLPKGLSTADPDFDEAKKAFAMDGLQAEAQYQRAQIDVELAREKVHSMGKDPDALGIKMPIREKVPEGDELAEYVAKQMKLADQQQWQAVDDALTQLEKAMAFAEKHKINLADLQHRGPPAFKAEAYLQQLQTTGQLKGADNATVYQKLILKEAADRLGYLQSAHMQPPVRPMPAPEAASLRAEMAIASEKKLRFFAGMDFTGVDFSGLDLRQFNFEGAWLEGANFSKANLSGANLTHAVLAHADFTDAIGVGTRFAGANLGRAKLKSALFDSADFSGAVLSHCVFEGTQMPKANLVGAQLLEISWKQADWTGVKAAGQTFYKLDMKGVTLALADISACNFIESDLSGADLREANLSGATFVTCKLDKVNMQLAQAPGAIFVKGCSLAGADLSKINFTGSNFGASKMNGVRLVKACLDGTNLSEANLSKADCRLASAKGALCRRMNARGAALAGVNFQDAILQHADLRSADLRSANLFGADLSRVKLDGDALFEGAVLERARTWPRLTPEQQAAQP
jgi:uncharacterized protein YjbI with pentapeptide repeats